MSETTELPFDLNVDAAEAWLRSIERLPPSEMANALNPVLSQLNSEGTDATVLIPILDRITATTLKLSNLIEKMALSESHDSEKGKKWLAATRRLPKKLAQIYGKLARDQATPKSMKVHCAYQTIQVLSLLIKGNTLAYEVPDINLWKSFAELYWRAAASGQSVLPVEQSIPGMANHASIESVAKQILLFYSCLPYGFTSDLINSAFAVSHELCQWLDIKNQSSDYSLCQWHPDAALLPNINSDGSDEEPTLYLDSFALIDYFDHHPEYWDKYRKYPMVLDRMTAYYDIRRSVNPSNTRKCGLIIGTKQAERFLNVLISRYRILELSDALKDKQATNKLELVPMESGNKLMASLTTKILSDDKSFAASRLSVYETEHADFCLAKIGNLPCALNEPVILAYEGQQPCFGIIRHLRVEANVKLKNLLIERIVGAVYPIEIDGLLAFIVFRSGTGGTELFLPSGSYLANQSVLKTSKGVINQSFVIEKFLEMNAYFSRYQVRSS